MTNTGERAGVATPQVYAAGLGQTRRLVGWSRLTLKPGKTQHVELDADPRLPARFDTSAHGWRLQPGVDRVALASSSVDMAASGQFELTARALPP